MTNDLQNRSPYKASWWRQQRALLWRCWLAQARDVNVFAARIIQTLIIALIIGLIYFQQNYNQKGVQNINGALFLFLTQMTFSNLYGVLNSFPLELPIFFREHHNGMYRVDSYFLCKNLAEIPIFIILPTIFVVVSYWMINLYSGMWEFLVTWLVVILVTKAAVSCGYFISTSCGRIDICITVAGPLLQPLMLFGGFFLNQASIPDWLIWMQYLSWFRFGNEILIVNQWSAQGNITCEYETQTVKTTNISTSRCFSSGQDVIDSLSYSKDRLYFDYIMLIVLTIGFRVMAFIALWIRARETKRKY